MHSQRGRLTTQSLTEGTKERETETEREKEEERVWEREGNWGKWKGHNDNICHQYAMIAVDSKKGRRLRHCRRRRCRLVAVYW